MVPFLPKRVTNRRKVCDMLLCKPLRRALLESSLEINDASTIFLHSSLSKTCRILQSAQVRITKLWQQCSHEALYIQRLIKIFKIKTNFDFSISNVFTVCLDTIKSLHFSFSILRPINSELFQMN